MKIRSLILLISVIIYLLLSVLLIPFYYLNRTINERSQEAVHVEKEHVAVKNLIISVSKELQETSDLIFFNDDDLGEAVDEAAKAFSELRALAFILHNEESPNENEVDEVQLYKNLTITYSAMQASRLKIVSLKQEGKKKEAIEELENVFQELFDKEFLPLAKAWIEAEALELQELEEEVQEYADTYLVSLKIAYVLALLILLYLFWLLNRVVTKRLKHLVEATRRVSRGDLHTRVEVSGNDEIATLARSFNEMTSKLGTSQTSLLEQCYLTGLNEASSDVLHNIKNALTGLILGFEQIKAQLEGEVDEDSAREKIEYLRPRLDQMEKKVADISSILIARGERLIGEDSLERYYLRDLINDSMNMLATEHLDKVKFYIDPAVSNLGKIFTHRIIFIQILSNLFTNACESITRGAVAKGLVSISAFHEEIDDNKVIHIYVTDNGEGIVGDDIEKIFERNFSKKNKLGLTGLGLHWCSNATISLNGRIFANSGGKDKGATFHLILPADND